MKAPVIDQVLDCLLNRGMGSETETHYFRGVSHETLVQHLASYLNNHRHFLGHCRIDICQALNDRGVDLLLTSCEQRVGFQIKSHYDATERDFSANVKRQFAEALAHDLDCYYVLICAAMITDGKRDVKMAVTHVLNEVRDFKRVKFVPYSPIHTIRIFRTLNTVSRDELLSRGAINDDALHDFERGYEHLPEVDSRDIAIARERFDSFGDEFWDDDEGMEAFGALNAAIHVEQARQFNKMFLPTLPEDVSQRRSRLIAAIESHLAACRNCRSWNDRSEYKLPQWLDYVPENMIPYTSLPNLLRLEASTRAYLIVHREKNGEAAEVKSSE